MTSIGDEAQIRTVAETVGRAAAQIAIQDFVSQHPHFAPPAPKAEIPAPLKWAAIIISGIMTFVATGAFVWGIKTLNDLQLTVARIDERQQHDMTGKRLDAVERVNAEQAERIAALEQGKRK